MNGNSITEFSQATIKKLDSYVYILQDPRDSKIIYIGKGTGNRVFEHVQAAINDPKETDKLDLIREINKISKVKHYIVRHGIDSDVAHHIEATLIDLFTNENFKMLANITNIVSGHYTKDKGMKSVEEINFQYSKSPLRLEDIKHNVLVININKTFNKSCYEDEKQIYEATRKYWRINEKRLKQIEYVFSEYKGLVLAVFKPFEWLKSEVRKRMYFNGEIVTDQTIKDMYLGRELEIKKDRHIQNPIYYILNKS
ncbi:MAG TPA: excinuclease ABC [Candidatus Cloacimonadota bacterium]|nr:excinuclease ABC [Candidatus Cloacimonadota bacterium]